MESQVASSRRGFLAVARKGRYLLKPGQRHLGDLQVTPMIILFCVCPRKKMTCLVYPTMPLSPNLAAVL